MSTLEIASACHTRMRMIMIPSRRTSQSTTPSHTPLPPAHAQPAHEPPSCGRRPQSRLHDEYTTRVGERRALKSNWGLHRSTPSAESRRLPASGGMEVGQADSWQRMQPDLRSSVAAGSTPAVRGR